MPTKKELEQQVAELQGRVDELEQQKSTDRPFAAPADEPPVTGPDAVPLEQR